MPVYRLGPEPLFPPPEEAEEGGLLAVGGDLSPERLVQAYAMGIFPWYDESQPILWFSPDPRMLLRPPELRISRSLARTLRRGRFEIRLDTAFERVIRCCSDLRRQSGEGTWITEDMVEAYCRLHDLGLAHSAEAWRGDELAGGLYGVSLGSAFFGESMFTRASDASKAAFVTLVQQLERWDFDLVDCQLSTPHLARFGAVEWPRAEFLKALAVAVGRPTRRGAWRLDGGEDRSSRRPSGGE